jgi:hypothetical protein
VAALLSVVYAPEKGNFEKCRLLCVLRHFLPSVWKKIYARLYFNITIQMMDEIVMEVEKTPGPKTIGP